MKGQRCDCPRCHGLIVETYSDVASPNYAGRDVIGWRCVNCGEYVDRLVLLNRWAQQGIPPLFHQQVEKRSMSRHPSPLSIRRRIAAA